LSVRGFVMKRKNVYIESEHDDRLNALAGVTGTLQSKLIRVAIEEYLERNEDQISDMSEIFDEMTESDGLTESERAFRTSCQNDITFFTKQVLKINSPDHGIVPFELYDFQNKVTDVFNKYNRVILNKPRQVGMSLLSSAHLVHYALHNPNKTIMVITPTQRIGVILMGIIRGFINDSRERFSDVDVLTNNKLRVELSNGTKIIHTSDPDDMDGYVIDYAFFDEAAFTTDSKFSQIIEALRNRCNYDAKVFIASTPNGTNEYFALWANALTPNGMFKAVRIDSKVMPGRDSEWEKHERRIIGDPRFEQEYNGTFIASNSFLHISNDKSVGRKSCAIYDFTPEG
jgi:predicted DNA-binding protein